MQVLVEAAIRATFIAVVIAAVLRVARVTAPWALHAAWSAVTVVMLLLPLVVVWVPKASIPVVAVDTTTIPLIHRMTPDSPVVRTEPATTSPDRPRDWLRLLAYVYATGVMALLLRVAIGLRHARGLVRTARVTGGRLAHPSCLTPVTVGVRPTTILPTDWQHWSKSDLDVVLAHEQAHVRRRDPLFVLLALINRAVFWFHPLAWWLHRQVARLAEEACDEAVLAQGHDARNYADCLVRFAVAGARGRWSAFGMHMPGARVRPRVERILDGSLRAKPSTRRLTATALLCGAAIAVCAAAAPTESSSTRPSIDAAARVQAQPATADAWQVFPIAHFDIFYQRLAASQLDAIAREAERAYERVSGDLKHELAQHVPLILVARQRDTPANRAQADLIIRASGAPAGDHVILGVDAVIEKSDLIGHELTHVFLFDIIPQASSSLPWLSEGLAEYERGAWNRDDLATVQQAAAAGRIPLVESLEPSDRQWGHAVSDFISSEFGREGIRRFLFALRQRPQLDTAAAAAFDVSLSEFNRRFIAYVTSTLAAR
jgi:BlaR1 peptidase M56